MDSSDGDVAATNAARVLRACRVFAPRASCDMDSDGRSNKMTLQLGIGNDYSEQIKGGVSYNFATAGTTMQQSETGL